MVIGIITLWTSNDNYGQLLQCYALQRVLREHGHKVYLIHYNPWAGNHILQPLKDVIKRMIAIISPRMKQKLKQYNIVKERDFEGFRNEYIVSTRRTYYHARALKKDPPHADCYIVGSDQVWRTYKEIKDPSAWYLLFGGKSVRRISYAASMGESLSNRQFEDFRHLISHFDAVSVREESLKVECERHGIHGVKVTLDPTLLLDKDMYPIADNNSEGDYLFLYILNVQSADEFYWKNIKSYLEDTGLEGRIVYSSGYYPRKELAEGIKEEQLTIPRWISAVRDARYIITTSFHGVAFSILFHRPFLAICLKGELEGANSRIHDLLEKLGLSSRIYTPELGLKEQLNELINWEDVDMRLSKLRDESILFLVENLE